MVILVVAFATATTFVSCATKEKPRLVAEPDEGRESTIPWDRQEKWETGANLQNMASDRR